MQVPVKIQVFLFALIICIQIVSSEFRDDTHLASPFHGANRGPGLPSNPIKRQLTSTYSFAGDNGNMNNNHGAGSRQSDNNLYQIGPFNFVESLPKVLEIFGLGCLWIRAMGVNTGIPFFYPILLPLLLVVTIAILFMPNMNIDGLIREIESTIG